MPLGWGVLRVGSGEQEELGFHEVAEPLCGEESPVTWRSPTVAAGSRASGLCGTGATDPHSGLGKWALGGVQACETRSLSLGEAAHGTVRRK